MCICEAHIWTISTAALKHVLISFNTNPIIINVSYQLGSISKRFSILRVSNVDFGPQLLHRKPYMLYLMLESDTFHSISTLSFPVLSRNGTPTNLYCPIHVVQPSGSSFNFKCRKWQDVSRDQLLVSVRNFFLLISTPARSITFFFL